MWWITIKKEEIMYTTLKNNRIQGKYYNCRKTKINGINKEIPPIKTNHKENTEK